MLANLTRTILVVFLCATMAFSQQAEPPKPAPPAPDTMNVIERLDLVYAKYGDREMHLDLFLPIKHSKPLPAVMVVHGGGWLKGDKTKFRALAQALAARGYAAAAVEYRLGGEAKFPAAIHDCNAATRWIRANGKEFGIDTEQIAAVGGSAGGHLVGLMAAAPHVKELQGEGGSADVSSRLSAAVVLAGPMELATGPVADRSRNQPDVSNSNKWLGKTVDEAPELYQLASPLRHVSKACPPVLFMTGEYDQPERNAAMRKRLAEFDIPTGVQVYSHGKHGCWNREPWFSPMVSDIDAFFRSVMNVGAAQSQLLQETAWGQWRIDRNQVIGVLAKLPEDRKVLLPRLNNPVESAAATLGNENEGLTVKPLVGQWQYTIPKTFTLTPNADIHLKTIGLPWLPTIPQIVSPDAKGALVLPAHSAEVMGELLRYEPQPHKNVIGYWANENDWCQWRFYVETPGEYAIEVMQGCGKDNGGSKVQFIVGDQRLDYTVVETGHFQKFETHVVGNVKFAEPGVYNLQVKVVSKTNVAVMDIRQITLSEIESD